MIWLLDTNVVSEPGKPRPDLWLMDWMNNVETEDCALSVITIGELQKGVHALPPGPARRRHEDKLAALRLRFEGRILPVSEAVVDKWGELLGCAARPLPALDNLIAATAAVHSLTLATRNTTDIEPSVKVFNPFLPR